MKPSPDIRMARRPVSAQELAEVPLATVAWRARRVELRRQKQEMQSARVTSERLKGALIQIAEELFQLRLASRAFDESDSGAARAVALRAKRIEEQLGDAGIDVLVPEGEEYAGELMELVENVARRPGNVTSPRIEEMIGPVILFEGKVEKMGKAVIAIPETGPAEETEECAKRSERSPEEAI